MLKVSRLDGKSVAYTAATTFKVQTKAPEQKSGWKTLYTFTGELAPAVHYYNCINIGRGYAKRLYSPDLRRRVLAKATS